jgi:hypothetical protein
MSLGRKISKFIRAMGMAMKNPARLNALLDDVSEHELAFKSATGLVDGMPQLRFTDLLPEEGITIEPFAFLSGGSMPTDLALIRLLAKRIDAQNYFEIGTWRGESVMQAAACIPTCYTLNLSVAEMQRRNWDSAYIAMHGHFIQNHPNVKRLEGDSRTFDFTPYAQKMDLVFVDGDHHFDSVRSDTGKAFELIKHDKGIIIWHDYASEPENVRWNVLRAIWEGTPVHCRKHLYAVSNSLCAVYYPFGDLTSEKRVYPANPGDGYRIRIEKR